MADDDKRRQHDATTKRRTGRGQGDRGGKDGDGDKMGKGRGKGGTEKGTFAEAIPILSIMAYKFARLYRLN